MTTAVEPCTTCSHVRIGTGPEDDPLIGPLLPTLVPWLSGRRWFAHDKGCLDALTPLQSTVICDDGSVALLHALLEAHHDSGTHHRYQILLGMRRSMPSGLKARAFSRARGGAWEDWWLYDATEDPELMAQLLADTIFVDPGSGPHLHLEVSSSVLHGQTPRLLTAEQSNTSVAYGDRLLLKFFRRPEPGPHPELEVLRALNGQPSSHAPRLAGWLHTEGRDLPPMVLGVLTDFLANDGDGWQLAVDQAAECMAGERRTVPAIGGFTEESRALGAAVAQLHGAMRKAFPHPALTARDVLAQITEMENRLAQALAAAPALEPYAHRITGLYDDYAQTALRGSGIEGQRVHGDLHLGQVLHTADGWRIIDFEGEPDRPVQARGLPSPAMRDIAGMLRSFDYASRQALVRVRGTEPDEGPDGADTPLRLRQERRAHAWTVRNRRAFSAGYASAGGIDPYCHPVALRAFEADKAVYEALYEARHRPSWLPIPLAALDRLVSRR